MFWTDFYHWSNLSNHFEEKKHNRPFFMVPIMSDRVDALEERLTRMEVLVHQSLVEFYQSMLEEFAILHMTRKGECQNLTFSEAEVSPEDRMDAKRVK